MSDDTAWPFAAWLDVAVRIFGISPQVFWNMSLYDWFTLMSQRTASDTAQPINRQTFSNIMNNFPDKQAELDGM